MVDKSCLAMETANEDNEIPLMIGSKEYEMIELFRRININRPIAVTLTCLAKGREISSQSIEMVSGLRQPEISVAMRYLYENGWIDIREEKKSKGQGRPIKLYRLTVPMDHVVSKIEEEHIAESKLMFESIERLKKIT